MNTETKTEANVRQAVPFFAVSNIEASVRYYVDGIGFEMTKKWIDEGGGKVGEGVTIYFLCDDALAIYREVTSRGLRASKPMVGNGMWETSLSDPDGYKVSFESPTDRPEDTEYEE